MVMTLKKEYSRFAPFYRLIGRQRGHFDVQVNYISKFIACESTNYILDAACGTGDVLNSLTQYFPKKVFYGADFSSSLLKFTKNLPALNKDNIILTGWRYLSRSFNFINFDCIFILGNSIAHSNSIKYFEEVVFQVSKILKNDGLFIFDIRDWEKNKIDGCFNAPSKQKKLTIKLRNTEIMYETNYHYKQEKHFLTHRIEQIKKKDTIINLSFLDISSEFIINILKKYKFKDIYVENEIYEYPFISFVAKKCK